MPLSISEQVSYSTTRITCTNDQWWISTGTGFFFLFKNPQGHDIPVIITNKHVVRGMTAGSFLMTRADAQGEPICTQHCSMVINSIQERVVNHSDENVDLCAIPIADLLMQAINAGISVFYKQFDSDLIPTGEILNSLHPMEDVLMVGYPIGLWDSTNNMPIFRRGITATHPCLHYNGKREFMVDLACFPGSSWSPVLIFNVWWAYSTRDGTTHIGTRIVLLGVLYAGPQYTNTGEVRVVDVPVVNAVASIHSMPVNLGLVIKSERITELWAQFLSHT